MYQTLNDTPSRNFLFIRYNLVNTFRSFNYIVSNMLSFLSSSTHRKPISDKKILFISHPSALKCQSYPQDIIKATWSCIDEGKK